MLRVLRMSDSIGMQRTLVPAELRYMWRVCVCARTMNPVQSPEDTRLIRVQPMLFLRRPSLSFSQSLPVTIEHVVFLSS